MTGGGKVVWMALGMDSVARNNLRARVWVSVLCFFSCSCDICLSLSVSLLLVLLGASVMSWRGMAVSACMGGEAQGSCEGNHSFLGIQLSFLLPWWWSLLRLWRENSSVWLLVLSVGAELLLHPLLKCMGILTRMHRLAGTDLCSCDVFLLGLPSALGWQMRWGLCGPGSALGCCMLRTSLSLKRFRGTMTNSGDL